MPRFSRVGGLETSELRHALLSVSRDGTLPERAQKLVGVAQDAAVAGDWDLSGSVLRIAQVAYTDAATELGMHIDAVHYASEAARLGAISRGLMSISGEEDSTQDERLAARRFIEEAKTKQKS